MKTSRVPRSLKPEAAPAVPLEIVQTAAFFFTENAKANKLAASAKKRRALLLGRMKDAKLAKATFTALVGGEIIPADRKGPERMQGGVKQNLVAVVSTPKNNVVSIEKLAKHVDMETLFKIVAASQKAVLEHVSESVLNQCLVEVDGTENVSVELAEAE